MVILLIIVWVVILLGISRITVKLDCVGLIVHYLKKRRIKRFGGVIYRYPYLTNIIEFWPGYFRKK